MKLCSDAYFYETLFLKINWNLDRAPLNIVKSMLPNLTVFSHDNFDLFLGQNCTQQKDK